MNDDNETLSGTNLSESIVDKGDRFYWLQLPKNFFEDYKIKILLSSKHGSEHVMFYLKLLLESINRGGALRFSPERPYTIPQLAAVLDVKKDVAASALRELIKLELVTMKSDKTIYIPGVEEMTRTITKKGLKKREERLKKDESDKRATQVRQTSDISATNERQCRTRE